MFNEKKNEKNEKNVILIIAIDININHIRDNSTFDNNETLAKINFSQNHRASQIEEFKL